MTGIRDAHFLSAPHRVLFCGFESTTTALQQAGWSLSANQDFHASTIQLALRNKDFGGYMLADSQHWNWSQRGRSPEQLTFVVRRVATDILVYQHGIDFQKFSPIDAVPQYLQPGPRSIKDFSIFAPALTRTEEIIVEPQSVAECLELIRKMQAPELAAVRHRNAQRDYNQPINQTHFHAQIVSLAA